MDKGVCLIAYGEKSLRSSEACIASLREYHDWPVMCDNGNHLFQREGLTNVQKSRWSKVNLAQWSPFGYTLYLDADTRIRGDVSVGFQLLQDGWELVITASEQQGVNSMWHIARDEREYTWMQYNCGDILQLQGGVFWFHNCERVKHFFTLWCNHWLRWMQQDQAAMLRALREFPLRVALLGRCFNGGAVVTHYHGQVQ